jgi:type IV pilus assembly protein PilC
MKTFAYVAKNPEGLNHKGLIEAADARQAAVVLRQNGLLPVSIKTQTMPMVSGIVRKFSNRVPHGELVNFTRQLSTMITAGLNLPDALSILQKQTSHQGFKEILSEVLREVEGGISLASSMGKHPKVFNQIYVSLVRAGETAGVLDNILARLAENLEKEKEFKAKVQGAMIYPLMVVCGMIGVVFLMMVFVIPKMTEIFSQFEGAELPFATKLLIGMSAFCVKFYWLIILITVGLTIFIKRMLATPQGREYYDRFILKVPIIGGLRRETMLAEFTRTFGLLIGAGIPILEALKIVSAAMGNMVMEKAIQAAAFSVERGRPLAENFTKSEQFPPILGQMMKTGEETGKLDEVMSKVSVYFETEAEHKVKNLMTAIEPIILVFLALGVAFLMVAIIMPIYTLTSNVG